MAQNLRPLEFFLGDHAPTAPDVNELPQLDARIAGTLVGRGRTTQPTVLNVTNEKGEGFPVDLAQITPQKAADAVVPAHAYGSNQDAAVATFHRLAQGQRPVQPQSNHSDRNGVIVRDAKERQRAVPVGRPEPQPVNPAPVPQITPGYVEQGVKTNRPNLVAPPLSQSINVPTVAVTYEIPGYGPLDILYHQVIRNNEFLILVRDKRFPGQRGFPRPTQSQLGMHIHGTDKLFMVVTTGLEFDLDNSALCALRIVKEGSHSAYMSANDPLTQSMNQIPFPGDDDGEAGRNPTGFDAPRDLGQTNHDQSPGF